MPCIEQIGEWPARSIWKIPSVGRFGDIQGFKKQLPLL